MTLQPPEHLKLHFRQLSTEKKLRAIMRLAGEALVEAQLEAQSRNHDYDEIVARFVAVVKSNEELRTQVQAKDQELKALRRQVVLLGEQLGKLRALVRD